MWTSDFMYVFTFTTITGTLLTIIWFLLGRILERAGFLNIAYRLLQMLSFFWICPVTYVVLKSLNARLYRWCGFLFLPTPFLTRVSVMVFAVWVLAEVIAVSFYLVQQIHLRRRLVMTEICENEEIRNTFFEICEEMNIPKKKVALRLSEFEETPMVARIFSPVLVLQKRNYVRKELEVIFRHELTHIKHRDVLMKNLAFLVCALNAINPVAWWYLHLLDTWSEYACDEAVCRDMGSFVGYYDTILQLMQRDTRKPGVTSGLVARKSRMRKRVEHVKRAYLVKKRSKVVAVITVTLILLSGTMSVGATSLKAADGLVEVIRRAEIYIRDGKADAQAGYVEPITVVYGEVESDARLESLGVSSFSWTVPVQVKMLGPELYLEEGQSIVLSVVHGAMEEVVTNDSSVNDSAVEQELLDNTSENGATGDWKVSVGLIQPNSTSRYVIGTGQMSHTFTIEQSGIYRVFVMNKVEEEISVDGRYMCMKD